MNEVATLAGGCFWCTEAIYKRLKGVKSVIPGYAGGMVENPSYQEVCTGMTGHAESIQIEYDPKIAAYRSNFNKSFFIVELNYIPNARDFRYKKIFKCVYYAE